MPSITRLWLPISACIGFVIFVYLASVPFIDHIKAVLFAHPRAAIINHILVDAPKQNVWADLSENEALELRSFLFSRPDLNLTEFSKATRFGFSSKLKSLRLTDFQL